MKFSSEETLLNEFVQSDIADSRKYEIAKILERNREIKELLIERIQSVNQLSKDCSSYLNEYVEIDFQYTRKIAQATTADEIIFEFQKFQDEIAADPIVLTVANQQRVNNTEKPVETFNQYLDALDKVGVLEKKKELILNFQEIDQIYKQYAIQRDVISSIEKHAPNMKELQSLTIKGISSQDIQNTLFVALPDLRQNKIKNLSVEGFATDVLENLSQKMPYIEKLELSEAKRRDGSQIYQMQPYSLSLEELAKLKNIKSLGLVNVGLQEIPKEIFSLRKLENLDVSRNQIKELPRMLEYKGIKALVLDKNELTSTKHLPCTTLRELSIRNNKINTLDERFVGFMAISEMTMGADKKELIQAIQMQGNAITFKSLPQDMWKDLVSIVEVEKIAKNLGMNNMEKEKLNNLFSSLSQNQHKSLTI